ncbi:MAG: UDP-N-acetylmuramoyl-L-alanyl-D-glutamate--2,6-diaminopimelate ligase [Polyangiales bacterium]
MTVERNELEPHATLTELATEIPGSRIVGDPSLEVRDVQHDARDVQPGDAFVARRGQKRDGAEFAPDAIARGAKLIITERELPLPVAQLVVADAHRALAFASSAVWRHPSFSLEVLGVTGTNGKTTTTWLIEHVLERCGVKTGLLGTVAHRFRDRSWPALHTTPESDDLARRMAAMRAAGAENLAMEVSSHALALGRVEAVRFRVAAFTNLTQDHLDFHGSMDAYAAAKRRLFTDLGPAASVLNVDDATGSKWASEGVNGLLVTYSASGKVDDAMFCARTATADARGMHAVVDTPDGRFELFTPMFGWHNLENVLCAAACAWALDIPAARAFEALRTAVGAPGRLERVHVDDEGPLVFVDYAHSPDALTNVLRALDQQKRGRILCVFGCGGDRDVTKRAPMGDAVGRGATVPVLTTDNPRTEDPARIASMAEEGLRALGLNSCAESELRDARGGKYAVILDRRAAIRAAIDAAAPEDIVLIAGKGHEPYQEIDGVRHPFDDRFEAHAALTARRARG